MVLVLAIRERFFFFFWTVGGLGCCRPEAGKANEQRTRLLEVEFLFLFFYEKEKMSYFRIFLFFSFCPLV